MAQVVRFHSFGGPEVLRVEELEVGEPGAGEVRIKVGAFGLNRVESLFRSGLFGTVGFPSRIGYEAAGVVDAVGPDVTAWKPGDRVATLFGLSMEHHGTHADAILYPADMLVPVADGMSLADAAASWMQYGTAFALVEVAGVRAGDFVVITAASSSVGLAAIQIARAEGAVPIAVTRGRGKAAVLAGLGAAHVIVSDEEDVPARVMEITGGKGARIVFDALGGAPMVALVPAVAEGGYLISYGMLSGYDVTLNVPVLMMANVTLRGFAADYLVRQPEARARLVDYIGRGLASGALRPVIDRTFALEDVAAAHAWLEGNAQVGKIVVTTRWRDA